MSSNFYVLIHRSLCSSYLRKRSPDHTGTKDTKKGGNILLLRGKQALPNLAINKERATTYIHALTKGKFADHQKEQK